jgi:hypothetical protein
MAGEASENFSFRRMLSLNIRGEFENAQDFYALYAFTIAYL